MRRCPWHSEGFALSFRAMPSSHWISRPHPIRPSYSLKAASPKPSHPIHTHGQTLTLSLLPSLFFLCRLQNQNASGTVHQSTIPCCFQFFIWLVLRLSVYHHLHRQVYDYCLHSPPFHGSVFLHYHHAHHVDLAPSSCSSSCGCCSS